MEPLKKSKSEIIELLVPVKELLVAVAIAFEQIAQGRVVITLQKETTEICIEQKQLVEQQADTETGIKRDKLLAQLQYLIKGKLKSLDAHSALLETTVAHLTDSLEFMEESVRTSTSEEDLLKVYTYVVKQVEKLTTTFKPKDLQLNVVAELKYYIQVFGWFVRLAQLMS